MVSPPYTLGRERSGTDYLWVIGAFDLRSEGGILRNDVAGEAMTTRRDMRHEADAGEDRG